MTSIFDQNHIFIVFNPGSGGNFIAGILNGLLNYNLTSIATSSTGSAHSVLRNKSQGTDFLSFGTMIEEHEVFATEEARELFYIENIKKEYTTTSEPEIVWSHDFTNIPLYRKYFKNSTILVITNNTDNEKLTSLFMNLLKTILDKNLISPLTDDVSKFTLERWMMYCGKELKEFVSAKQAEEILQDRFNEKYQDLLTYLTLKMMLRYYCMTSLVEDGPPQKCMFDYVLYPLRNSVIPYKVGNRLESYIDDQCVTLPYSYLANNDSDLLINKLSLALKKNLTDDEKNNVRLSFNQYRAAQNQTMLTDPKAYFNDLKNKISSQ